MGLGGGGRRGEWGRSGLGGKGIGGRSLAVLPRATRVGASHLEVQIQVAPLGRLDLHGVSRENIPFPRGDLRAAPHLRWIQCNPLGPVGPGQARIGLPAAGLSKMAVGLCATGLREKMSTGGHASEKANPNWEAWKPAGRARKSSQSTTAELRGIRAEEPHSVEFQPSWQVWECKSQITQEHPLVQMQDGFKLGTEQKGRTWDFPTPRTPALH